MVIEVEKELVAALKAARESGDEAFVRCCELTGVPEAVPPCAYSPDVEGDSEEARTREMDRMVNDRGISIDHARLLRLYLAMKGHQWSQYREGYNFHFGCNVAMDYTVARYWYAKAAESGNSWAQNNLGVMYADGLGGAPDQETAVYWYMKSAENGDETAKGNLGEHFAKGTGARQSYRKAARLLREYLKSTPYSAKHHFLLAECYEHGVGGRNGRRLAMFHYQEASDFGSIEARKALRRMNA